MSGASERTEGGGTSPSDRCCCKPMRGQMYRSPVEEDGVQPSAQVPRPDNSFNGCQGPSMEKQHTADWRRQRAPFATIAAQDSVSSTEAGEQFPKGEDLMTFSFSFATWCMSLTRWALKSRTGFGHYLSTTLSLTRDGPDAPPTALFPLPMPVSRPYAECPEKLAGSTAEDFALDRALHVMISALNYMYWSRSSPPLELIRRQPNEIQSEAIKKLRRLLKACDPCEPIKVACSGRRNLQLMARLQELALAAEDLGLMRRPYQEPTEEPVPTNNSWHPQLSPFSNLQPSRLKISGRGQWDARQFLDAELYMPFVEPQSVEMSRPVFERGLPNFGVDKPETVFELFQKWDELGLLVLHPRSEITTGDSGRVKVFNSYKNEMHDRQIGDRRERNAWEGRVPGPSAALPVGPMIGRLVVPPGYGLKTCVTDRSDYYHQISVSHERSRTNIVWPPMPLASFLQFKAYDAYHKRATNRRSARDRTVVGDFLDGHRPGIFSLEPDTEVYGSFGAILQGDHLGVEFGISAHVGLLQSAGLLEERGRLVADSITRPNHTYQGLCIDDFFSIAPVPEAELMRPSSSKPSQARAVFDRAKAVYADFGLAGSDQKDVVDSVHATVVGAQIDSRDWVVKQGFLPVGAPSSKRLALSWIAAAAARLPVTSDALHSSLVGGLVSVFCFRKCCMSILQEVFKVIPADELDTEHPRSRALPRQAAEELILSAVLTPLAISDVKAPFHKWVYASDASTAKGAFCRAEASEEKMHPLWQAGDFKGARTFLDSWQKQTVGEAEFFEEEDWETLHEEVFPGQGSSKCAAPARPLAQHFDFLEVCGGSGVVSDQVAALGYVVGPIIDLTYSCHYDLLDLRAVEWLLFMVQNRRVRAVALEPPCTTFSPAAYPPCRSYRLPRGFNQKSQKVWVGNRLAFACLTIFLAAVHALVLALLETPRRSKMAWLSEWKWLLGLPNVEETYTASCMYGSPHQKEFRFLTCNMRSHSICRPCSRNHKHIKIEGKFTKGSAVYCPGLAKALAQLFAKHLEVEKRYLQQHALRTEGLESVFVNEFMKVAKWQVRGVWKWSGNSHINILEASGALRSTKESARQGGGRTVLLLDSNVSVRSIAKGRSSARALGALLRKIACVSLAFSVFLSVHFCPTRLNVADDPTRSVPLRASRSGDSFLEDLDFQELFHLAEMPKLRRWISNWTSLFLGLCHHHQLRLGALQCHPPRFRSPLPPVDFYHHILDFDSTLGFPGEGPQRLVGVVSLVFWTLLVSMSHGMQPRNEDDGRRAQMRKSQPLFPGRPVRTATRSNRAKLLEQFGEWLAQRSVQLDVLLSVSHVEPETLVSFLVAYGKELYEGGRPYSHYAETINAIAAAKPTVRRLLTAAWDLAFSWVKSEPGEHHTACPFQVLLALLSTAIFWGWPIIAGILALSWGAVCRIGEVTAAFRRDLVLPIDVLFSSKVVYLKVQNQVQDSSPPDEPSRL